MVRVFSLSGNRLRSTIINPMARREKKRRKEERTHPLLPARIPKAAPVFRICVKLNRLSMTGMEW